MTAVLAGVMSVQVGDNDGVLAGGTESMSTAVFYIRGARYGLGTGNTTLVDALTEGQFQAQPQEIYGRYNMGVTADNVAKMYGNKREDTDYVLNSEHSARPRPSRRQIKDEIVRLSSAEKRGPIGSIRRIPARDVSEKLALSS
jgi:acetyl-CoA C-acetyltransferase